MTYVFDTEAIGVWGEPSNLQVTDRQPPHLDIGFEPLAVGIRSPVWIHDIKCDNVDVLVNLYPYDLLICLSDPVVSAPNLMYNFKSFS